MTSSLSIFSLARALRRLCCLMLGLLLLPAAHAQINGLAEDDDELGSALAMGDFDCDGHADLAIGVPGENTSRGAVNVVYGTASGLDSPGDQSWSQATAGVNGVAEDFDLFGYALAAGDFDGNGCDDLAIGSPYENVGTPAEGGNAGAVNVLYGTPGSGLSAASDDLWTQNDLTWTDAEPDDRFGWSLAVGDFDGDGYDDLAVGSPFEDISSINAGGVVHVLFGTSSGLSATGNEAWYRSLAGFGGSTTFDLFGWALAAGDFDDDGRDDLAISMTGYDINGATNAGGVGVLYGTNAGLEAGDTVWSQDTPGVPGVADLGDQFGYALAAGDFGGDGDDDLAIGVPFEHIGGIADAGAVNILYGVPSGLTATSSQLFRQGAGGINGVAEAGDRFGFSLVTGDFGRTADGYDDLGIGVPGESVGALEGAGAVNAIYGASGGLSASGDRIVHQNQPTGIKDVAEADDQFGYALAAADVDGDGRDEVAIGVPGESVNGAASAGAVNSISFSTNQFIYQGAPLRPSGDEDVALVAVAGEEDVLRSDRTPRKDGEPASTEEADAAPMAQSSALPGAVILHAAYPNPFAARTTLGYALAEAGPVRLVVYDALGRKVARLVDATHDAGEHTVAFDAAALPSGTYLVRLEAGGTVQTQRLTLMR